MFKLQFCSLVLAFDYDYDMDNVSTTQEPVPSTVSPGLIVSKFVLNDSKSINATCFMMDAYFKVTVQYDTTVSLATLP